MAVQFFLTKDPALLVQYFELRNRVFRKHYPGLAPGFGDEEEADRRSHIVVGHDSRVVAGGRITISFPHKPQRMPMEESGFRLSEAVPQFGLKYSPYAEFSRVTVDPACAQGRRCGVGLIRELAHRAAIFGVDLVFSMCPLPMVRMNEWNSRICRVDFQAFPDIVIPNPFAIHMILCAYTGLIAAECPPLKLTA